MTLNNLVSCTHTELRYNNGHFFLLLGKKILVGTKMPNNAKTNKQKTTTTTITTNKKLRKLPYYVHEVGARLYF